MQVHVCTLPPPPPHACNLIVTESWLSDSILFYLFYVHLCLLHMYLYVYLVATETRKGC